MLNVRIVEIFGVLLVVTVNVLLNPVHVGFFRVTAVMPAPDFVPHFVQKLGGVIRGLYITP